MHIVCLVISTSIGQVGRSNTRIQSSEKILGLALPQINRNTFIANHHGSQSVCQNSIRGVHVRTKQSKNLKGAILKKSKMSHIYISESYISYEIMFETKTAKICPGSHGMDENKYNYRLSVLCRQLSANEIEFSIVSITIFIFH